MERRLKKYKASYKLSCFSCFAYSSKVANLAQFVFAIYFHKVEETAHRNDAINVCWLPYYLDKYFAA